VRLRTGVGGDAAGGNGAAAQRPQESLVPGFLELGRGLDVGQGTGHALPGVVHADIHRFAQLGLETVFLVPDVVRSRLQRNGRRIVIQSAFGYGAHRYRFDLGMRMGSGELDRDSPAAGCFVMGSETRTPPHQGRRRRTTRNVYTWPPSDSADPPPQARNSTP